MYDQLDIVLILFPYSDLTGSKQRPALIVSNKRLNKTQDRLCCLVTSKKPSTGIPLNSFSKGTLPFKSWVKPQRLFTIDKKIIKKRICKITPILHKKIVKDINSYIE